MKAEDEKVSTDELQEKIAEFEDYVQSTDIAAMQSWASLWRLFFTLAYSFLQNSRSLKILEFDGGLYL